MTVEYGITILNHLKACEQAFLIRKVPRQDLIGKRILAVDEKYYVEDCGLRRAIVHGNLQDDIGQVLENVVYHELCRQGWAVTVGRVKAKEVDFVCDRGSERMYVHVTYLMPTKETRERESGALLAVPDKFPKMGFRLTASIWAATESSTSVSLNSFWRRKNGIGEKTTTNALC